MKKILVTLILIFYFYKSKAQTGVEKLDKFIQEWMGRPYKFGGTTKNGIDCSAFVMTLYREVFGFMIQRVSKNQWSQTSRVHRDSLMVGDLVFFNSKISPSGWHVGVYIGSDQFVHAANIKHGVKISSLSEPQYEGIYRGAGRLNQNKEKN